MVVIPLTKMEYQREMKLSVLVWVLFAPPLLAGVLRQTLPTEPPATVLAISWSLVLAEAFVIGVLWRELGKERDRSRTDSRLTREILNQLVQGNRDINEALDRLNSYLRERYDIAENVKEILRRTDEG